MNIKSNIEHLLDGVSNYIIMLQQINDFEFNFTHIGLTDYGKNIKLGPSCYALKIFYMLNLWDQLSVSKKEGWVNYINSYQSSKSQFLQNSYIDTGVVNFYNSNKVKNLFSDSLKTVLNLSPKYNFNSSTKKLNQAINADTKQAIATLHDIGAKNRQPLKNKYKDSQEMLNFLNNLDWTNPWSAGGQYSSLCVYSATQNYNFREELVKYSNKLVDRETGAYFNGRPKNPREVINGAMKIISGLDWLDVEIHDPIKLIDFCLSNKPNAEGCDIVDFIYVLYKCSKQSSYRHDDVKKTFTEVLVLFEKLSFENSGFSYFPSKSQTHYYGVNVSKGVNAPDIHGTILSTWALVLIYDFINDSNEKYNIIKP